MLRSKDGRSPKTTWWFAAGALVVACVAVAALAVIQPWDRDGGAPPSSKTAAKASFDSLAPVGAPAHWLPPEDWVYNHWLPYDEGRLYALLGVTRGDIWRQLRDDHHNVAELARAHGWPSPRRLAEALVDPRRHSVSAAMFAQLRDRALRTITQGHLAQHLFFHSLHQFAIASEAPRIFGVTDAEFRALRRGEQSPLDIGRVHGRAPSQIQGLAAAVLRQQVRTGVRSGAMTPTQGRLLLDRQLAQLPRWLAQVRYNGPPPTHEGKLVRAPRDYAANPAISADGRHVVFEAYRQRLPQALARGEISVQDRALGTDAPVEVSQATGARRGPQSMYNPSVSADGGLVAFESSAGNRNFAKRYGAIRVQVRDAATGRSSPIGRPGAARSQSQFNPRVSADGRAIAYQAVGAGGHSQVLVTAWPSQHTELVSRRGRAGAAADADTYEPSISGDGQRIAFVSAASNLGAAHDRSQVFVRDRQRGITVRVSRASATGSSPAMSGDGRHVAFVEGRPGGRTQVYLRDLQARRTVRVSAPADGAALGPAVSASGRFVAYTVIAGGRSRVMVRDLRRPRALVVSRASGRRGALADRDAEDPTVSADGRRVAFSSTATNLATGKPDDRRGVFVRDLRTGDTRLVSAPVPPPDPSAPAPLLAPAVRAVAGPDRLRAGQVLVIDNAFRRAADRPVVHLRTGQRLSWLWASRQSHQVTLASGPTDVRSPTKTAGRFSARLTEPGTYRFVCSIHAPGMRMTAVVRPG